MFAASERLAALVGCAAIFACPIQGSMSRPCAHPVLHSKLLSSVWDPEYGDEREYLRTFILQLRRKLEDDPSTPVYLRTVNYLGYVFSDLTRDAPGGL